MLRAFTLQLTKHLVADQSQSEEITRGSTETAKSPSGSSAPILRVSLSVDEKRRHVLPTSQDELAAKDLDKREREGRAHGHRGRKRSASPTGVLVAEIFVLWGIFSYQISCLRCAVDV